MSAASQNISVVTIGSDSYLSMDGGTTFTKSDAASSPAAGLASFTKMWDSFKPEDIDKPRTPSKTAARKMRRSVVTTPVT